MTARRSRAVDISLRYQSAGNYFVFAIRASSSEHATLTSSTRCFYAGVFQFHQFKASNDCLYTSKHSTEEIDHGILWKT